MSSAMSSSLNRPDTPAQSPRDATISELVELSNWLGAPQQDCTILGEGNTSAIVSDSSFLVKASGTCLGTLDDQGFVEVDTARALAMLEGSLDDHEVRSALIASKVDPDDPRMPSVETSLHAVCLSIEGINFVGHTHPTAINAITCSRQFPHALEDRLFPDEVVVCGVRPLLIPYVDPGIELAKVVQTELNAFVDQHGTHPKTIYLQSHGFIALGTSASQVKAITEMSVKSALIRAGVQAFGGPQPMTISDVIRINNRLDEHYRQKIIDQQNKQ